MKAHPLRVLAAVFTAAFLFRAAALAQAPSPDAAPLMRAIVYRNYGSPDVLRLEAIERPVPADNQVLVKVRAASVNPLDWHYMRGSPYIARLLEMGLFAPKVTRLGVDFAGTVESVGKDVTKFKPGDEVFGGRTGAFGEYVCVGEDRAVVLKPANMTFEQAAAVPIAAVTALQGLRDRGKLQPGQRVLINGASGGVGTFAVQIAKSLGADVTGVCSTRNIELVRSIGADRVIDYTKEDFTRGGQPYDLILDMIGNHSLSECRRVLTPKGTLVLIGSTDKGRMLGPLAGVLKLLVVSRFVSQDMGFMLATLDQGDLTILSDLMQSGKITPVIDRRYRLSEVPQAIGYVEEGHARGKVVIAMDPDDPTAPLGASVAPGPTSRVGPALTLLAVIAVVVGAPIAVALALNRRFRRLNPGKRAYRWGFYFAIQSLIGGIVLGMLLDSGVAAGIACAGFYGLLAWFFARRRRWAWVALTILSFNPAAWIINAFYLRKRWAEDTATAL